MADQPETDVAQKPAITLMRLAARLKVMKADVLVELTRVPTAAAVPEYVVLPAHLLPVPVLVVLLVVLQAALVVPDTNPVQISVLA